MVAQDTGGAIRGPVRGDVFWGHGTEAELRAGKMKSPGRYHLLIPGRPLQWGGDGRVMQIAAPKVDACCSLWYDHLITRSTGR